ncbi:hypothetical protein AB0E69_32545 [Kribbella sp. NPDC026611]|uniref:hypothetical protein n=1 Tax=Kribbella sp. NPDC026611 TaxID=3154911 RepID=UPI0034096B84
MHRTHAGGQITEELRALALDQVDEVPTTMSAITSPHEFLSACAKISAELARQVEAALQTAEIKAVRERYPYTRCRRIPVSLPRHWSAARDRQ